MATKKAEIGDTIVITNRSSKNVGNEFTVVECPYRDALCECKDGKQTWLFDDDRKRKVWLSPEEFKVVKRYGQDASDYPHPSVLNDAKSVDAFLKGQMDNNLRNIFG